MAIRLISQKSAVTVSVMSFFYQKKYIIKYIQIEFILEIYIFIEAYKSDYFSNIKKMIIKDAFWQILGRVVSAIWWFIVLKFTTPFLGPLRFGDYNTILKYFAIWSALADFGLYVIALREIGNLKSDLSKDDIDLQDPETKSKISNYYSKFVTSRIFNIFIVYGLALLAVYFIPSYTDNVYLIYGLPLGMIFSATFMLSGIVQIPLQLYRKMEQTSIALTIARISQIIFMLWIIYIFRDVSFDQVNQRNVLAFLLVVGSVLISWVSQYIYTQYASDKYIKFRRNRDREFTKNHILKNWKYGLSYYFSSFHILLVGIALGIFFPTIQWFKYVWIWWLAMSLVEILLIIPSSIGNSLIHKIATHSDEAKKKSYGHLMTFLLWLGGWIAINFAIFNQNIIDFVSWPKYLTAFLWSDGADYILWFLGIVVILTFIKQTYNYIMVTFHHQNKLFEVNGIGLLIWWWVWLYLLYHYNIWWWVATQVLLEVLYVLWGIYMWFRLGINPIINRKRFAYIVAMIIIFGALGRYLYIYFWFDYHISIWLIVFGIVWNLAFAATTYILIKKILREMWHADI